MSALSTALSADNPLNMASPPMLTDEGKPIVPRFRQPQQIRDDHLKRWNADANNRLIRAWVQRMLDSDPPYDQARMVEAGLSSCANYSAGYGKRAILRKLEPYVQAFNTLPIYLNIATKYGTLEDRNYWGSIMSRIHKRVIRKWRPLRSRYLTQALYSNSHGASFAYWPDSLDWRWETASMGDMVVDRLSRADTCAFERVSVERDFKPSEIWAEVKDMKEDEEWTLPDENGWNKMTALETIQAATGKDFFRYNNAEFMAAKIKNLEAYQVDDSKVCTCIVYWELETNGTVTQYIVPKKPVSQKLENEKFLFRRTNFFKSMEDGLVTFCVDIGTNGYFHSIRGTGSNIYTMSRRRDILNCRLDDAVNLELSTMVQATEEALRSGDPFTFVGPLVFLTEGVSLVPDRRSPNFLQTALPIVDMFRRDYLEQQGAYPEQIVNEGNKDFLDDTSTFSGNDVMEFSLFHDSWERLLIQSFARMHNLMFNGVSTQPGGKEAWLFKKMCLDEGVPLEAIKQIDFDACWASKPIGNGSPKARQYSMEKILPLIPSLDQQGQNTGIRMYISALPGMDESHADELAPRVPDMRPTQEVRNATYENNILMLGGYAEIEPNDNHIIHLSEHVKPMQSIAQQVETGQMDEAAAIKPLYPLYLHSTEHLEAASQDKVMEMRVSEFNQVIHDLGEIIVNGQRKLQAQQRKEAEAQQSAQQEGQPPAMEQGGERPVMNGLTPSEYRVLIETQLKVRAANRNEMERQALHNARLDILERQARQKEQDGMQKRQIADLKASILAGGSRR